MEQPSHRVLIIDSDERTSSVIENLLANDGFEVTTACRAERAVDCLRSGEYDLVLVDDHFADLTSSCFLKELLRIPQKGPVIIMEGAPSRPCGIAPYNPFRASRLVNKCCPCEILEAAHDMLRTGSPDHEKLWRP